MAIFGFNTAESTLDLLRPVCDIQALSAAELISFGHHCDLTPLDYYLWGAVKDKCYADKPETIDVLKDNIRESHC